MDCRNKEEMEFGLRRKRRISLDLFSGSSFETVLPSSCNTDPAGGLKEMDLIRCLMKSSGSCKEDNHLVSSSCSSGVTVDCTLSLGLPRTVPSPDEQHAMDVLKEKTMQASFNVMQIVKSTLLSHRITNSELEASYNIIAPFSGLYNMSSSMNNHVYRSQPYNAETTSNPTTWLPITHSRSKFVDSNDILAFKNHAIGLGSEMLLPARPNKTSSNSNPSTNNNNNNNGSSIRMVQQKQRRSTSSVDAARMCSTCHTTTTPLWRNGPKGAKSLCNACGIRHKKEERRVASAMVAASENSNQFVKAFGSNSIVNHDSNKISATPQLKPSKKLKLQPIGV